MANKKLAEKIANGETDLQINRTILKGKKMLAIARCKRLKKELSEQEAEIDKINNLIQLCYDGVAE